MQQNQGFCAHAKKLCIVQVIKDYFAPPVNTQGNTSCFLCTETLWVSRGPVAQCKRSLHVHVASLHCMLRLRLGPLVRTQSRRSLLAQGALLLCADLSRPDHPSIRKKTLCVFWAQKIFDFFVDGWNKEMFHFRFK